MTFVSRLRPAARRKAIAMYREGKKVPEIMEATGVAKSTLYWLLRQEGVTTRQKSGPRPKGEPTDRYTQDSTEILAGVIREQRELLLKQEREIGRLQERLRALGGDGKGSK